MKQLRSNVTQVVKKKEICSFFVLSLPKQYQCFSCPSGVPPILLPLQGVRGEGAGFHLTISSFAQPLVTFALKPLRTWTTKNFCYK